MLGLDTLFRRVFGTRAERLIKSMQPTVARINELESRYTAMTDAQLRGCTADFRQRIENGATLDDLLPEAFAVVREAGRRTMNMRHFDVQLIGGMVIHRGMVAEMKTGEGKTLVGTAPVYLNALSGKGVHVVTVNDYLAQRDAEWMGRIYRFLGLSVGTILSMERNEAAKRAAYAADITYGTNNEFGFDYLRDNMKFRLEDMVQRGHNFAIVDEVDSILIDEARTPLIISGPTGDSIEQYYVIDQIIPLLQKELDFTVDEKSRSVSLTDDGMDKVEGRLGVKNLYATENVELLHHVNQALKAHFVFKRDKDYVVSDGKVVIVDEHTGRLMHGRRWSDGLHQAVEAKERVKVEAESQTYATITFQNYFRMYGKLAGMTGTADTEAEEFGNIYKLEVVPIPTNRGVQRLDHHDIVYKTQAEKFRKVLEELEECYAKRQPVLVGTTSVEKSELVHRMLEKKGIPHEVLNAKNNAREAEIVAQAGRLGAITISTNMAGRGTDITLGGDPAGLARVELLQRAASGDPEASAMFADLESRSLKGAPPPTPSDDQPLWAATVARYREQCERERKEVMEAGGLHILGTERHESRRIDNQLRGRSGRQGDPGSSRFYLSLEDDLMRIFGSDKLVGWMERLGMKDDEPIEHRWITSAIEEAQKKVEGQHFNSRKNLLEYDDVMNLQRKAVYDLRRRALTGENVRAIVEESIEALVADILDDALPKGLAPESWDTPQLLKRVQDTFGLEWEETPEQLREFARQELTDRLLTEAKAAYVGKEQELGEGAIRQVERQLILQFADQLWKDHLLAMDRLRDGIGLRGYGQRNPLLEYKKEAFNMFQMMNSLRDEAVLSRLVRLRLAPPQPEGAAPEDFGDEGDMVDASFDDSPLGEMDDGAPEAPPAEFEPIVFEQPRFQAPQKGAEARLFAFEYGLKRNDPCPCGSGQKFKKCCYEAAEMDALESAHAAEVAALEATRAAEEAARAAEEAARAEAMGETAEGSALAQEDAAAAEEAMGAAPADPEAPVDATPADATPTEAATVDATPADAPPTEALPAETGTNEDAPTSDDGNERA